jgi:hypothetical protein
MSTTAERPAPKNTGLKILVAVLGIILVFGFFGLIAAMVYQAAGSHKRPQEAPGATTAIPLASFGDVTVPIRQGERIARIQPSGDRLIVELATVEGNSRLVVIDQRTGKVLGTIAFPQQP